MKAVWSAWQKYLWSADWKVMIRQCHRKVKIWARLSSCPQTRREEVLLRVWFQSLYLRKWPPSVGSAAHPCSPPCQAPAAGTEWGGDSRPHPPGREGALGVAPAESARPARNCWHPVSAAGSQYGRTSGPLSESIKDVRWTLDEMSICSY